MFNKFSRSCAQSDELEKGSAFHSPLFRFLSFAVCLALMLGIFALIPFPASASNDITSCSYMGYPVLPISYNSKIECSTLLSYCSEDTMYCFLMTFEDDTPYIWVNGSGTSNAFWYYSFVLGKRSDGYLYYTDSSLPQKTFLYFGDTSDFRNGCSMCLCDSYGFDEKKHTGYSSCLYYKNQVYQSSFDTNQQFYIVFVPASEETSSNPIKSIYTKLLSGTKSEDGIGLDPSTWPEADFVQFPVRDDNKFYMIDWISDGYQYPIFDFWINDKNNLHTYSLKFSSNSSFAQDLYDQEQQKGFNEIGYKYYSIANYLKLIGQNSIYDLQWDYVWSLSDSNLQFTNSNMKAFSINLSDYFTLTKFLVYRCQIVDNNTGSIIATTYFTTNRNFNKSNSGYGSNVYEYTNKDNLITDTTNNNGYSNGYIHADTSTSGNTFESNNPNDIVHTYDPTNLDIDISSIFGVLNQSTQGIGSFFQACFNVIPAAILSIITAAVALLVILRILGR